MLTKYIKFGNSKILVKTYLIQFYLTINSYIRIYNLINEVKILKHYLNFETSNTKLRKIKLRFDKLRNKIEKNEH
jgi:hypothetical protein